MSKRAMFRVIILLGSCMYRYILYITCMHRRLQVGKYVQPVTHAVNYSDQPSYSRVKRALNSSRSNDYYIATSYFFSKTHTSLFRQNVFLFPALLSALEPPSSNSLPTRPLTNEYIYVAYRYKICSQDACCFIIIIYYYSLFLMNIFL